MESGRNSFESVPENEQELELHCHANKNELESYCHVRLNVLDQLEDSTKKLLGQLEVLKSQTLGQPTKQSESVIVQTVGSRELTTSDIKKMEDPQEQDQSSGGGAGGTMLRVINLQNLEVQTSEMEDILKQVNEEDGCSCSIFDKLSRKCICMKDKKYNDFVIHFNENTKFTSTTLGEVMKNMRILKKFLYMGGDYTKHALRFLNEGLTDSVLVERKDIVLACAYTDICNIFEDSSIVNVYIMWPCKFKNWGDTTTQLLAAKFLNNLSQITEGKDYLNLNSKIVFDLNQVLKRLQNKLEEETVALINSTLMYLSSNQTRNINVATYFCKAEKKTGKSLPTVEQFSRALPSYMQTGIRKNSAGLLEIRIQSGNKHTCRQRSKIAPAYT